MNESDFNDLKSRGRKLTAAEEADLRAWLAEHPDRQGDWEAESRLTEILSRLPDVPVPSNFTARVLQAVERETQVPAKPQRSGTRWFFRLLVPRLAVAAVILGLAVFTYTHQEHQAARRAQLVQGVQMVAGVSSLPSPEILQDFDTIRQMSSTPGPDPELIALMK